MEGWEYYIEGWKGDRESQAKQVSGAEAGKLGSICTAAGSHPSYADVGKVSDSSVLQFPVL